MLHANGVQAGQVYRGRRAAPPPAWCMCVCERWGGGVREAQTHGTKPAVQSQNTLFLYDARSRLEDAALRRICRRLDLKPCFDDVQLVGLPRTRARAPAQRVGAGSGAICQQHSTTARLAGKEGLQQATQGRTGNVTVSAMHADVADST